MTRIIRLTTVASTGFLTKRSVNFIRPPLLLVGLWIWLVRMRDGVFDGDRNAILELRLSGAHDHITSLQSRQNGDLIAAGGARGHHGMLGYQCVLARRVLPLTYQS